MKDYLQQIDIPCLSSGRFMKRAVELARKGMGRTSPNPCVGAVIVKDGEILGEGWHKKAGEDHAEIVAMKDALEKNNLKDFEGATLYVTLEPCAHEGKTPACAGAIAEARFQKVCVGMRDPFVKVNGKGIKFLEKNKIEVEICPEDSPIFKEIKLLNQPFLKFVKKNIPYVILKAGMSVDGKIALQDGTSKWITSELSRKDSQIERSKCDAVLVGYNTVRLDNPSLFLAKNYIGKKFLKIVLDPSLESDISQKIFKEGQKKDKVFVACTDKASLKNRKKFEEAGIKFKSFGKDKIPPDKLLKYLGTEYGVQSVFVEGGSSTHGLFLDAGLVDKIIFYIAPKLIWGKDNLSVTGGDGIKKISESLKLHDMGINKIGDDFKLEGFVSFY